MCFGVEHSWPKRLFKVATYAELKPHQKRILQQKMIKHAVNLYRKYVDRHRLKRRMIEQTNRALAPYYAERFLRNRYYRLKALADAGRSSCPSFIDTHDNEDEIEKHLRLLYEDSCDEDDEYLSANVDVSDVSLPPQMRMTRSQTERVKANIIDVRSDTCTLFITPIKDTSAIANEQLHILLAKTHSDDILTPTVEQQFEMFLRKSQHKNQRKSQGKSQRKPSPEKSSSQTIGGYLLRSKDTNVSSNLRNLNDNVKI